MKLKIGFIGAGNMCRTLVGAWLNAQVVDASEIFVTNRSPGKLKKMTEQYGVQTLQMNEDLVDEVDVIVLAMKPQDLAAAVEPISSSFREDHVVVSLAAGVQLRTLKKLLPQCSKLIRVMPNTPAKIKKGVIGYCLPRVDAGLDSWVEHMFSPLGLVVKAEEGETFEALAVSCSAGVGFVFELMIYWKEWLEEHGYEPALAQKMTVQTFLGASLLAEGAGESIEDLQNRVASKKGITAAGLDSLRELEVERLLRYSFEKAAIRDKELSSD